MAKIIAIFRREFAAYFNSPLGYLVIGGYLLLFGIAFFYFPITVFESQLADMRGFFSIAPWLLVVIVPTMTMRLVAEERQSGTLELLMTLPLTEWQLVLGKYMAAVGLLAVASVLTISYPITLSMHGDLDWGPVIGGYLGLVLLSSAYAAIGLWCSALTSNQIVAAMSSFLLCLLFFLASYAGSLFDGNLAQLIMFLGFDTHFRDIQRGVIDTRHLVYYVSMVALFLSLTVLALRRRRLAV